MSLFGTWKSVFFSSIVLCLIFSCNKRTNPGTDPGQKSGSGLSEGSGENPSDSNPDTAPPVSGTLIINNPDNPQTPDGNGTPAPEDNPGLGLTLPPPPGSTLTGAKIVCSNCANVRGNLQTYLSNMGSDPSWPTSLKSNVQTYYNQGTAFCTNQTSLSSLKTSLTRIAAQSVSGDGPTSAQIRANDIRDDLLRDMRSDCTNF